MLHHKDVGMLMGWLLWANLAIAAQWQVLPDKGRVFSPLLADPREATVRLGYMKDTETHAEIGLGGDWGLLAADGLQGQRLTLSARALMTSRFEFGSGAFDLVNIDYIGGVALGYGQNNTHCELSLYHQSSHLGDEMMIPPAGRSAIRYHYEALRFLVDHTPCQGLRLYAGPSVRLRSVPESLERHWGLQVGWEWRHAYRSIPFYVAMDVQWRQFDHWQRDMTSQIGLLLGGKRQNPHRKRMFLEFHDGLSTMGQFYRESEHYVLAGLGVDW